ncbi:MAG: type II and III secretion system protein family protein [Paracoccaceae bacterium]
MRAIRQYVRLMAATAGATFAVLALAALPAGAQGSGAPVRVLNVAEPTVIDVAVNRALVLEAAEAFAEVSVANPGIADVAALTNRSVYVLGKQAGRTTLTLLGPEGRLIANIDVRVAPDVEEFKARLQEILPDEPIEVRTASDGIVLSGTVSGAAKLDRAMALAQRYAPDRVTNMMSVGGARQIMLRVRFAEVQRNATKSLGFNWGFGATSGNWGFNVDTGDFAGTGNAPQAPGNTGLPDAFSSGGPTEGTVRIGFAAGGVVANLAIDALEGKGVARTLAEPNLVSLSGDTASFLAGGEFPIPVPGEEGELTIEFKPFGVSLGFTPTVVDGDVINLVLEAESSAIDNSIVIQNQGITFNGFSTRRTRTTIELRDGQSFAIAGLLQDDFVDNAQQLPWVGDVPVLGTLFRSADFQRRQTELVILVTAYLAAAATEAALELPTDRIRLPSERELFLLGKVELEPDPGVRSAASRNFEGTYGYVVE